MTDEPTPIDEQAFDAMLGEMLGNAGPPDLSDQILRQFHQAPARVGTIVALDDRSAGTPRSTSLRKHISVWVTVVATLAATILIAIWLRSNDHLRDYPLPNFAGHDAGPIDLESSDSSPQGLAPRRNRTLAQDANRPNVPGNEIPDAGPPKPRTGIPLVIGSSPDVDPRQPGVASPQSLPSQQPLQGVVLVSRQLESQLRGYWDVIGIEPAGDASDDEIVKRLSLALGVELPAQSIGDPQQLQAELTQHNMARAIAAGWLQQITQRGLSRIDQEAADELIDDLAACFRSDKDFDRTLADWIGGQSASTSAFYAALSSGPKHAGDDSAMIRRLAALTMNVDLRCTRCHDSYIEGNGRQEDFWAFAAFISRGVTRDRDGQVTIDASSDSGEPYFYDLPDGRRRFIEQPSVAMNWMDSQSDSPISSVREWSEKLVGSEELARGVVNSLWQLVHGQPLRGRVVDPISAPHNESLDRLEESLVEDLMRSQFDISRSLALVIASPATRRGVPASLLPENALVADESDIEAARHAVDAFAAAEPQHTDLPLRDRLDQVSRATGAKLSTDASPIVAQLNSTGIDTARNTKSDTTSLAADFPGPSKTLPVQWLARIGNETSQVEHLAYLAGMSEVPESVLAAAKTMGTAGDAPTALNRVWWMVRP